MDTKTKPITENNRFLNRAAIDQGEILSGNYWNELRVFLAIAKSKSFNQAADRLGIAPTTVGRRVRRLQDMLKTTLFVSGIHGVQLTPAGVDLAVLLARLDMALDGITKQIGDPSDEVSGTVRVTITEGLTIGVLNNALHDFSEEYPKVAIRFENPRNIGDFRLNSSDIMLSLTPDNGPDLVCNRLGTLHMLPVCSPRYYKRHGVPTLDDISEHTFVQCPYYAEDNEFWKDWNALVKQGRLSHWCENTINYGLMIKAGHGVGILANYATEINSIDHIDLGVDVKVPLYGIAFADSLNQASVRIVFEWLCDFYSANNPWFQEELTFDHDDNGVGESFRFFFNG